MAGSNAKTMPLLTPADLTGLTIPVLLERQAEQSPFRIALSARSVAGFRDRLSYAQLVVYMRRIASGLAKLGVQRGDRVGVYLTNDAGREAVLTALGCFSLGAAVVPLNTRSSAEELSHALHLVRPLLVVTAMAFRERVQNVYTVPIALLDGPQAQPPSPDVHRWPEPTVVTDLLPSRVGPFADDTACLLYTSGTTSRPKAVVHSHSSMLHAGLIMGLAVGLNSNDLYQGAFPFFTSSCLNIGCMSSWVHGAGFVMEHDIGNAERLRLVESECVTVYHGVPAILQFMLDEAGQNAYDLCFVRRIAYGGAAMPPSAIERIARCWPWMEQVHVWGMTESGPAGAWLPPQLLAANAGSMGQAMPYCELRVIDDEGRPTSPGTPGELLFRGPSMAAGYFENPQATAEGFHDGWLHTGDVVVETEDGLLWFLDRKKDVVNRGGLKISSVTVEATLLRYPGIAEVAVIGIPHDRLGEDVAACIVPFPHMQLDMEALKTWCTRHLADYEVPRHWKLLDALPKNPMGKVLKRNLRQMLLPF